MRTGPAISEARLSIEHGRGTTPRSRAASVLSRRCRGASDARPRAGTRRRTRFTTTAGRRSGSEVGLVAETPQLVAGVPVVRAADAVPLLQDRLRRRCAARGLPASRHRPVRRLISTGYTVPVVVQVSPSQIRRGPTQPLRHSAGV